MAARGDETGFASLAATLLDDRVPGRSPGDDDSILDEAPVPALNAMSTGEIFRRCGWATLLVLAALNMVDDWDRAAFTVLAPNIRDSLGLSTAALTALHAVSQPVVVAGALVYGSLADRVRHRPVIVAISGWLWAAFAALTALVHAPWQLVGVRLGTGLVKANQPVDKAILADRYPIEGRARVLGFYTAASPLGAIFGPLLAGAVAALASGDESWRLAFPILAIPATIVSLFVVRLHDPERGQHEQERLFGAAKLSPTPARVRLPAAVARLKKARTYHAVMVAIGIAGVGQVSVPIVFNLLLADQYHLSALQRGFVGAVAAVGTAVGLVLGARSGDRRFREAPETVLHVAGAGVALYGVVYAIAVHLPGGVVPVVAAIAVAQGCLAYSLAPAEAVIASVTPYRLRGVGFALRGAYGAAGGISGAILLGLFSDTWGYKTALTIALPPTTLLAGILVMAAGRHLQRDTATVAFELRDELAEQERRLRHDDAVPALQVAGLDFSYGPMQVLFDVSLHVDGGETLALLGTNGAGKSTLLRAVSGLAPPDRGSVRLDGELVTFWSAEDRVARGLVQVAGGRGVFPSLTVRENLIAAAYGHRWQPDEVQRRVDRVVTMFPVLGSGFEQLAGTMSGGEQQMLALGKALMADPHVLLIDELSLGLAPVVVQQLIEVVDRLRQDGLTMIIVEQSLNVALTLADRAVFMEKGQVRFEGRTADLLDRDDIARAVFLGSEP